MNKQEAVQLVHNICAEFRGTLRDHQEIQEALSIIHAIVFPVPTPIKEEVPSKA